MNAHSDAPPPQITVTSTSEFFEASRVLVRAWRGTTSAGREVTALIAGLQMDNDDIDAFRLKPIPPPVPAWSEPVRNAMHLIWQVAANLSDSEAAEIAQMVMARALYRDPNWIEQTCERCEAKYHGPTVYCCLNCALADAK